MNPYDQPRHVAAAGRHRDSPRPRAPSYTGLPAQADYKLQNHSHHVAHTPPVSASPSNSSEYTTSLAYAGSLSGGRAPSISASSISSSSYAGSAADEAAAREVDLVALLTERLAGAFDPLQLDRSLAVQAQTSGMLNSKTRELVALQEEAQRRIAETRRSFVEGMKVAKQVKGDLDYVQRKVDKLKERTARKYPVEYNMARDRIPSPPQ